MTQPQLSRLASMEQAQVDSISSLASELQRLAAVLESPPLLDNGGTSPASIPSLENGGEAITRTRYQITDTARKLVRLALGPREALLRFSFNVRSTTPHTNKHLN